MVVGTNKNGKILKYDTFCELNILMNKPLKPTFVKFTSFEINTGDQHFGKTMKNWKPTFCEFYTF